MRGPQSTVLTAGTGLCSVPMAVDGWSGLLLGTAASPRGPRVAGRPYTSPPWGRWRPVSHCGPKGAPWGQPAARGPLNTCPCPACLLLGCLGSGASCVVLLLSPYAESALAGRKGPWRPGWGGVPGAQRRPVLQQLHPRAWPQATHSAHQCLRVPARIHGSDFHVHHDAFLLCEGSDSISALGAQCEPMTAVSRELRAHWVPRPSRALPLHQGDTLLLEFSLCIVMMVTYSGLKY